MPIRSQQGGIPNVANTLPIVRNFKNASANFLDDGLDHCTVLRAPYISNVISRPYYFSMLTLLGSAVVLLSTVPTLVRAPVYVPNYSDSPNQYSVPSASISRLSGGTAQPFSQDDWPNPQRPRPINLDGSTPYNINLQIAIPFSQDDWPNPQRPRRINLDSGSTPYNINSTTTLAPFKPYFAPAQIDDSSYWSGVPQPKNITLLLVSYETGNQYLNYRDQDDFSVWQKQNSYNIALLATASIAMPFTQDDWPNPQRTKTINNLDRSTSYNINFLFAPFSQNDWPTPTGYRSIQTGFVKSSDWLASPFSQSDWQNPIRTKTASISYAGHIETYKINLYQIVFIPFTQIDWPNPPRAPRPLVVDQLGYIDPSEVWMLQDTFFGPAGMGPAYDWPNPQRVKPRSEYGSTDFYKVLLFAAPPSPFSQGDWPNPKGSRALVADQLGYLDATEFWLLNHVLPTVSQFDWTNPQKPRQRNEYAGFTDPYKVLLFAAPPSPFYVTDWQNPKGPRSLIGDQIGYIDPTEFWLLNHVLPTVSQFDWTNPVRAKPASVHYNGHIETYKINLYQIVFVPFYQTDWSNPPRAQRPLVADQLGYLDATEFWLLNHVLPTVSQFDWPNPQRLRPINLDRSTSYNINLLVSFAPFVQIDWPNPSRRSINNPDQSTPYNINLLLSYPFSQSIWPNPRGAARSDVGFIPPYNIWLQQRPFAQTYWPNPKGPTLTANHFRHSDFYKINLFTTPLRQTDWPNPLLRQPGNIGNYNWSARAQLVPGNFQVPGAGQLLLTTYTPMLTLASSHHWRHTISLLGNHIVKNNVAGEINKEKDLRGNIDNKPDIKGG